MKNTQMPSLSKAFRKCPKCGARVRSDRMQEHLAKPHVPWEHLAKPLTRRSDGQPVLVQSRPNTVEKTLATIEAAVSPDAKVSLPCPTCGKQVREDRMER